MLTSEHFVRAYDEYPELPYHRFTHAIDVMRGARDLAQHVPRVYGIRYEVMDAAALFHDIVYVPGAKDNEERSAKLAWTALSPDFTTAEREAIFAIIMDTKAHQPDHLFIESCLVSDADMAGFAAEPDVFDATNRRIDDEFLIHGGVDPIAYAAGRRAFLEATLQDARAGRLYHVPVSLAERHERAIENLEREIAGLPE